MPSEWLSEMQGNGTASQTGHATASAPEQRPNRKSSQNEANVERRQDLYNGEESEADMLRAKLRKISLGISLVLSLGMVGVAYYMAQRHAPTKGVRGVNGVTMIASELTRVYDYVSTPDFRTEWHLGSVEVSGPAIDHSAVPGEIFSEEVQIGKSSVTLDWNVLQRQFPTSASSHFAEFVLEGAALVEDADGTSRKESWRQFVRMRGGKHQFAGTDQVQVEMEIVVNGQDGKDMDTKWKRRLTKAIKTALESLKDRVEEDTRLNPSPHVLKEKNEKRRQKRQEEQEAGGHHEPSADSKKGSKEKKKEKKKK